MGRGAVHQHDDHLAQFGEQFDRHNRHRGARWRDREERKGGDPAPARSRAAPHTSLTRPPLALVVSSPQTARPPPTAPRTARRRRTTHSSHPPLSGAARLKLANQHLAFSQAAEEALAASLEKNETLIKLTIELRSTVARVAINKALTRNQDKRRKARVAAGGADTRKVAGVNVADWAAEAERVASRRRRILRPADGAAAQGRRRRRVLLPHWRGAVGTRQARRATGARARVRLEFSRRLLRARQRRRARRDRRSVRRRAERSTLTRRHLAESPRSALPRGARRRRQREHLAARAQAGD